MPNDQIFPLKCFQLYTTIWHSSLGNTNPNIWTNNNNNNNNGERKCNSVRRTETKKKKKKKKIIIMYNNMSNANNDCNNYPLITQVVNSYSS